MTAQSISDEDLDVSEETTNFRKRWSAGCRRTSRVLPLLLLAVGLLAAGCRDDDDKSEDTGTNTGDVLDVDDGDTADGESPDTNMPDTADDTSADTTDTAVDGDSGTSQTYDLRIEGLSAPVTVQFDEAGVLHIDCETNLDCYAAQGYFHADHRFFEMDLIRRQTRGSSGWSAASASKSFRARGYFPRLKRTSA